MRPDPGTAEVGPEAPLEGDEGPVELRRECDLGRAILETRLSELRRARAATVTADATVARAVEVLRRSAAGAILVVDRRRPRRLVGVLTERDVVERVLPRRGAGRLRVERVMTPSPESLRLDATVAYALNRMSAGRIRHLPLVDARGAPVGLLALQDVIDFVVELIPEAVLNLPPQPELEVHAEVDGA